MFAPTPAHVVPRTALDVIKHLGLMDGLQLCLDMGDADSYPGSGQIVTDLSSNGHEFTLGATSSAEASDPTFTGTAGGQSDGEYMQGDGGDYLFRASPLASWMEDLGRPGSQSTFCGVVYIPSDNDVRIFSTNNGTHGVSFLYRVFNGRISFTTIGTGFGGVGPIATVPGLYIACFSIVLDGIGGTYNVNVNGTAGSAAFPTATLDEAPSGTGFGILCDGVGGGIAPSGTRFHELSVWNDRALTEDELAAIWEIKRQRYGL